MVRSLREEIRQRRPFESLEQEAHLNVVRTAAILSDSLDRVLKPAGISLAQYNVLRILRGAEPEGLCRNELRDRMISRMPDVTRLLDRMEEADLVRRERSTDDRRMVRTRITDRGSEILDRLAPQVTEQHRRGLGHLNESQLRSLIELLGQVRDGA
jgi:DNA-binding MarR family transcriptional regulator